MSDQIASKNDLDTDETTSWEILSDQQSSTSSSIENFTEDEFDNTESHQTPNKNDLEHVYIDITEDKVENVDKKDNEKPVEEKKEENGTFPKTGWKKLKSKAKKKLKVPKNFTILSITASVFAITGLTLLCCLFPSETDKTTLENIKNDYLEVVKGDTKYVQEAFNKTTEILTNIHNSTDYHNATNQSSEDECPAEENDFNLNLPDEYFEQEIRSGPSTSSDGYFLEDLQNTTSNLIFSIRDACLDPNVQILLCSIMQDVLLIKLIQHIGRNQVLPSTLKRSTKLIKKRKVDNKKQSKSKKLDKVMNKSIIEAGKSVSGNTSDNLPKENGKSECERRFEELENKWQYLGKNHRQKLQEIKEEFKSELFQMKGKEKEHSLRKQKIKSIRDKYVQKIRADRERYLLQLKKIKDERHRVMHEICRRKKFETQPKDASVGNYGIVMPENNLKTKLSDLNKVKEAEPPKSVPVFPNSQFEDYSKFWKNFSVPKIPKQEEVSSEDESDDENTDYMRDFVTKLICMTVSFNNSQDIWLPPKKTSKSNREPFRKSENGDLIWAPVESDDAFSSIRRPPKITDRNNNLHTLSKIDVVPVPTPKKSSSTATALQSPSTARFALRKTYEVTDFSEMDWKNKPIPVKRGSNEKFPFLSVPPKNPISIAEYNETENKPDVLKNKKISLRSLLKKSKIPSKTNQSSLSSANVEDKNGINQELRYGNASNVSNIDNDLPKIKNETLKKPDLYQLLFDIDGEKVRKKEEEILESQHKRFTSPPPVQMMSKQNPKLPKKVYLFKGRL